MGTVVSPGAEAASVSRQADTDFHSTQLKLASEGRRTFDPDEFEHTHISRLIGTGALLVIGFQIFYLGEGWISHPEAGTAAIALHLFNIGAGAALLGGNQD